MYHIATNNIGLGSYDDDFNHIMQDHFVKRFYTLGKTIVFNVKRAPKKAKARPSSIK